MLTDGKGKRRVTIKDIAKEAGVSYATVSRALSEHRPIKDETREKVLEVCERMGYMTNYVARSMVKKETRVFGIIIPSIDNPFMAEMAYHIESIAREKDYSIMLCNSSYDLETEEKAFTLLLGRQVDGIMLFPVSSESYRNLKRYLASVPTVFVNDNLLSEPESYVATDNFEGTRLGVEYLVELGHRKILYFGRETDSTIHQLRAEGYQDACEKYDLEPMFVDCGSGTTTIENGYQMAMELFASPRNYTAIMAGADTLALGVLQAADELHIQIPEELSLLGFDNIRYAALPKINLSTIEQPKKAIAASAVEMLIEKISSDYDSYSHRILMPTLVIRSSCMPPQKVIREKAV